MNRVIFTVMIFAMSAAEAYARGGGGGGGRGGGRGRVGGGGGSGDGGELFLIIFGGFFALIAIAGLYDNFIGEPRKERKRKAEKQQAEVDRHERYVAATPDEKWLTDNAAYRTCPNCRGNLTADSLHHTRQSNLACCSAECLGAWENK